MKALKLILAFVYIALIALLFILSCKGCDNRGKTDDDENDEDRTEVVEDSLDCPDEPESIVESPEEQEEISQEVDSIGGKGDLKITLLWDYDADMDLHVIEPDGTHIYYGNRRPTNSRGYLDVDNTRGGPGAAENVYWDTPNPGSYRVYVRYYSDSRGPLPADCKVVVKQVDEEDKIYDLHFTQRQTNINIPDIVVQP